MSLGVHKARKKLLIVPDVVAAASRYSANRFQDTHDVYIPPRPCVIRKRIHTPHLVRIAIPPCPVAPRANKSNISDSSHTTRSLAQKEMLHNPVRALQERFFVQLRSCRLSDDRTRS